MVLDAGKMYRPTDISFGESAVVYVAEQFNHRVSAWIFNDDTYTFIIDDGNWGSNNTDGTSGEGGPIGAGDDTDNSLYRPTGIAFDSDNARVYVTDTFHNRIRVIDSDDGVFLSSFGESGSGTSDFYHPAGIAVETLVGDTKMVIADELNHRAVMYDTNGGEPENPVVLADPSDTTGLSFVRPHGVVFDANNNTFNVTDSARGLISSYNGTTGAYIDQYGTPGSSPANVNLFYPGSGEGLLSGTTSTVFADTRNNTLKTMDSETIALTTGVSAGTNNGQLYYPESVSAFTHSVSNYVLVANTFNNRIEAYSNVAAALTFQANFGSP